MKVVVSFIAVFAVVVLIMASSPAAFASNGWGLEDPQLCVNGQLLTVLPAAPTDVYVTVPKTADVDFQVEDCGGKSRLGVVPFDNVTYQGNNKLWLTAATSDGTSVAFSWNGQSVVDVAEGGHASAAFSTK